MKHLIVGFGTLLDVGSLGGTIGAGAAQEKRYTPVIVKGYRRLFNLRPDHYQATHRRFEDEREGGAANVEPAAGFAFNGLAFEASAEEVADLDQRERYYRKTEVEIFDFESGQSLGYGLTYCSEPDARWIYRDNGLLMPRWDDIVLARGGAYRISRAFGEFYDRTTYLADGVTQLVDDYRAFLDEF